MKRSRKSIAMLTVIALLSGLFASELGDSVKAQAAAGKVEQTICVDDTINSGTVGVEVSFKDVSGNDINLAPGESKYTGLTIAADSKSATATNTIPAGAVKCVVMATTAGHTVNMEQSYVKINGASIGINTGALSTGQEFTFPQGFDTASGTIDVKIALTNSQNSGGGGGAGGGGSGGGEGGDPGMNFALTINVDGTQYVIDPDHTIINLPLDDISNFSFMIDQFEDLNDGTVIPLNNVGNNSGVTDNQGRNPLAIQTTKHTSTEWVCNLEYHSGDDPDDDNKNCPPFYFINVTFTSSGYKGTQIHFSKKPDMYQDTVYPDKVDISTSTKANPTVTGVYYDSDDFSLTDVAGTPVSSITVTEGFNPAAVTITGNTVTFNSGYYASIPLTITLTDGTVGYLKVDRLGIEIDSFRTEGADARTSTNHGSQPGCSITSAPGASTYNIVAVYYYSSANSYTDYDMIANLTYANGKVETKVINGHAERNCTDPSLKGGDYLVWSGASQDGMPTSVSVTAVRHGATSSGTFGGALFGAGKGITVNQVGPYKYQ